MAPSVQGSVGVLPAALSSPSPDPVGASESQSKVQLLLLLEYSRPIVDFSLVRKGE